MRQSISRRDCLGRRSSCYRSWKGKPIAKLQRSMVLTPSCPRVQRSRNFSLSSEGEPGLAAVPTVEKRGNTLQFGCQLQGKLVRLQRYLQLLTKMQNLLSTGVGKC